MNSYAFDYLSGAEALDDLDLTGAGKKKKKKKKKKSKAPAAPIAGYDPETGAPVYDEIIGYDARTGKPRYAQQEARRRALLAGEAPQAGQVTGFDEWGEPIYGAPQQPAFAALQGAPAAPGQGSMFAAFADVGESAQMPPGWTPQQWQQYLYTQRMAQNLQQGPGGQGPSFFSLVGDSGAPGSPDAAPVDYESAGGAYFSGEEETGGSFLDAGDFSDLYGGGMDIPAQSPMFRATGAAQAAQIGTPGGRARAVALLGERPRAQEAAHTGSRAQAAAAPALSPLFAAVSGSGCCKCAQYRKYPRADAIRDPF